MSEDDPLIVKFKELHEEYKRVVFDIDQVEKIEELIDEMHLLCYRICMEMICDEDEK